MSVTKKLLFHNICQHTGFLTLLSENNPGKTNILALYRYIEKKRKPRAFER